MPSLGALIFVAGIAIAPALAAVHSLTGQLAHAGTVTEAYTWLGTGMGSGIAIGAVTGRRRGRGRRDDRRPSCSPRPRSRWRAVLAGIRRWSLQPGLTAADYAP